VNQPRVSTPNWTTLCSRNPPYEKAEPRVLGHAGFRPNGETLWPAALQMIVGVAVQHYFYRDRRNSSARTKTAAENPRVLVLPVTHGC
jgi:hypothetical protein